MHSRYPGGSGGSNGNDKVAFLGVVAMLAVTSYVADLEGIGDDYYDRPRGAELRQAGLAHHPSLWRFNSVQCCCALPIGLYQASKSNTARSNPLHHVHFPQKNIHITTIVFSKQERLHKERACFFFACMQQLGGKSRSGASWSCWPILTSL